MAAEVYFLSITVTSDITDSSMVDELCARENGVPAIILNSEQAQEIYSTLGKER